MSPNGPAMVPVVLHAAGAGAAPGSVPAAEGCCKFGIFVMQQVRSDTGVAAWSVALTVICFAAMLVVMMVAARRRQKSGDRSAKPRTLPQPHADSDDSDDSGDSFDSFESVTPNIKPNDSKNATPNPTQFVMPSASPPSRMPSHGTAGVAQTPVQRRREFQMVLDSGCCLACGRSDRLSRRGTNGSHRCLRCERCGVSWSAPK